MHFTLTDLVSDITQNGAESGADLVELDIGEMVDSSGKREFRFTVKDNGKGMSQEDLKRVQDPFVTDGIKHPHRKVGLGIPFLIQTAEASGGGWEMESRQRSDSTESGDSTEAGDSGTTVSAWFDLDNVDTPPVGDIPGMFRTVLLFDGPAEVVIKRVRETGASSPDGAKRLEYEIRKTELIEALGDLEDAQSLILLGQYLRSLEENEENEE
jgi:hypothetical protein